MLSLNVSNRADRRAASDSHLVRHVVAYASDGAPVAYGSQKNGDMWLDVPDIATFHLPAGGASLTATPVDAVAPEAVFDAYYGTALPLVLQAARGVEVLHGSAVLVPSRGCVVAFSGTSGSGKSTIGYGLSARGYGHWADDAVAFRVDGAHSLTAVGLPYTLKPGGASDALDVVDGFAWKPARLAAVFLLDPLDRTDSGEPDVAVERLAPAAALRGLLANAFRFHPEARERRRETMRSYLELVASVPVLRARFRRDLDRLPNLLDELERSVREIT